MDEFMVLMPVAVISVLERGIYCILSHMQTLSSTQINCFMSLVYLNKLGKIRLM